MTDALEAEPVHDDVDSVFFALKAVVDDDAASKASEVEVFIHDAVTCSLGGGVDVSMLPQPLFKKRVFFDRPLSEMSCPPPRR